MGWHDIKVWIEATSGLTMDALHVHAGVLCLIGASLLLRRPIRHPLPLLVVLAAALANEWHDLRYEVWPTREQQWAESIKDVWNTLLLPLLLFLLARFAPRLLTGFRGQSSDQDRT
jgi:hypothetical protein